MIDNISNYEIIKLQPSFILMKNKQTRKVYRYVQQQPFDEKQCIKNIQSIFQSFDYVVQPIFVQTGILYDAGFMTLSKQISSGYKSGLKCVFDQKQIINTIQPLLKLIIHMHKKGQPHGNLSPDSIIIDQMGNLKVYYPGFKQAAKFYYSSYKQQIKFEDDYRAIAKIILQLLGYDLISQQNSNPKSISQQQIKILKGITKMQKYSNAFIFSLLCMLNKKSVFIKQALNILLQQNLQFCFEKLTNDAKEYYQYEILSKDKKIQLIKRTSQKQKAQFTPPLTKHFDHTPRKPIQTKRYLKAEDVQNKKYFEEGKKKKPIQQVLKKVSNSKNEGENTNNNTSSPSYKKILRDIRQTKERQDLFRMTATAKRMRTLSKKKIG